MQQNINPENDNEFSNSKLQIKNYKITKCKNKPFWLNISRRSQQNYQKYKSLISQQITESEKQIPHQKPRSIFTHLKSTKISEQHKPIQQPGEFMESILSDNQNYTEDFQSYHQSFKNTRKVTIKLPHFQKMTPVTTKNVKANFNKVNFSLVNSPHKKINKSVTQHRQSTKSLKDQIKRQVKLKTQQSTDQSIFDIDRQLLLNENTLYLRNQNQKLIRKIQQMRRMLPIYLKNNRQLQDQGYELAELNNQVYRAISSDYGYQIQCSRSQTEINSKKIGLIVKKMNSPKFIKKQKSFVSDKFILQINQQDKVRQKLLHQMRLFCLRDQMDKRLDQKISTYEMYIRNFQEKQKYCVSESLQRRKVFLEWDLQRLKNQFDIKVVQNNMEIQDLRHQIQRLDLNIRKDQKNSQNQVQKQLKQSQITIVSQSKNKVIDKSKSTFFSRVKEKSIEKFKPEQKWIKYEDNKLWKPQKIDASKENETVQIFKQSRVIPNEQKVTKSLKSMKQDLKYKSKQKFMIKKSIFKNAQLNEQLEQVFI